MKRLEQALSRCAVIPVITIADADQAAKLAQVLAAGGVSVAEVTLRTPAALDAIAAMVQAAPGLIVGAGTVLTDDDLDAACKAGARFIVTPGTSPRLRQALLNSPVPVLPGIGTVSEAMSRLEEGFDFQKFFPAEPMGGTKTLSAIGGPVPQVRFCPTGGIAEAAIPSYLALPNVHAVGGSWIVPEKALEAGDWDTIAANAARAGTYRKGA